MVPILFSLSETGKKLGYAYVDRIVERENRDLPPSQQSVEAQGLAIRKYDAAKVHRARVSSRWSRMWSVAAAMLVQPTSLSRAIVRLRRLAMIRGVVPLWMRLASSAKVTSRMWCIASICQADRTYG